ncbi:hypothetical protein INS49_014752 [Diaporthe citri]|uniref:uncharacterized protein n=1 Tax=Diaporthe citri TaxID=83186 RepID=UPI001C7FC43A|nr:uncharacterized protein INS49_014752 [Diaporthe citri]KAG6356877.1 hypothetical protein INS49_014752 [Diaporthe citri]
MSLAMNTSASVPSGDASSRDVALDTEAIEQLNSPHAKVLLDMIDSLRELRVGEIVQLPQIIVVGDQSSGKSSVLEAISGINFPVNSDLCTRFATELVMRRHPETKITVSIQKAMRPAAAGHDGEQEESLPFHKSSLDKDALPDIISEARERMGIRTGSKRFSKDILRVVVAGPDAPELTLVDLPGIFHSPTSEQTLEDKELVNELIEKYMQESKSIILVVVAANNQLANQSVLSRAKQHDPHNKRIVGVITKPDLVDGYANEKKYLDLCRGLETAHKLSLGWHVLRNSSEQARRDVSHDRDREEQLFFQRGVWASLPPANRGIGSLRNKLSKVLLEHIRESLPGLIREIENSLSAREEELLQLGKPRSTLEEMRSYLMGIAEEFQRLARDAVDGRYGDQFFGDLSEVDRKLRARLRQMNRAFDDTMMSKGSTYNIVWNIENDSNDHTGDDHHSDDDRSENGHSDGDSSDDDDEEVPDHLQRLIESYQGNFSDPLSITRSNLTDELENLASLNQGKELPGVPNAELGFQFFKEQAKPWRQIAEFHLDQVQVTSKAFVDCLFGRVIGGDHGTTEAILKGCADPFFDKKSTLLVDKLQELLRPYTTGYGLPLEREFRKRTLRHNSQHFLMALEIESPELFQVGGKARLRREDILESIAKAESLYRGEFGTDQVIDMMKVHYEMSRSTFIENVINLAVENCLICDIPSIMTPMGRSSKNRRDYYEKVFKYANNTDAGASNVHRCVYSGATEAAKFRLSSKGSRIGLKLNQEWQKQHQFSHRGHLGFSVSPAEVPQAQRALADLP